jgi:hypothetical protein
MIRSGQLDREDRILIGKSTMRRAQRLIAGSVLIALTGVLGGCSSGLSNFDPSDMLDFLDTKKKLPGDRKPVFPDGVPGVTQGVPKELYKGAQQDAPAVETAAVPPPQPAEEPKGKKGRKGKSAAAVAPAASAATSQDAPPQDGEAAAVEEGAAGVPPAPKPKKIARRRTTAPPADDATPSQPAQTSSGGFPAPMPSGTFSR